MSCLQTNSGRLVDLRAPRPDDIVLADIAHALSHIGRFTGHTTELYTVAQHSVLAAMVLRDQCHEESVIRAGLMHDATEAYVGDVSTGLKSMLPEYARIESDVWNAIVRRFHLSYKLPKAVKVVDSRLLVTEARDLLPGGTANTGWPDCKGYDFRVTPWSPIKARRLFLQEAERCGVY